MQGVATPALTNEELIELEHLRGKYEKLKTKTMKASKPMQAAAAKTKKVKAAQSGSSSDSEVSFLLWLSH
jgi:hypothetical protein